MFLSSLCLATCPPAGLQCLYCTGTLYFESASSQTTSLRKQILKLRCSLNNLLLVIDVKADFVEVKPHQRPLLLVIRASTNVSPSADITVPSQQELDLLFGPLYDEFFNDGTSRVNKYSSPTENSIPKDTLPSTNTQPTSEPTTLTNVHAEENNDNQAEFTNPFCTPVQENVESSSRNIGTSNMHTFNQPQDSEYRWTKDHP
ncbi:hypothetical protein Tco_0907955 [Tanacetum coccineum]|uniref:Uncharacterized protein n=1 Tax=Tanacetum coccineum TaxID=301880 RepID=A0ABQ5CKZ2_9ASTR